MEISKTELNRLSEIARNGLDLFEKRYGKKLDKRLFNLYNNTIKNIAIDIQNITNRYIGRDLKVSELIKIRQSIGLYENIFNNLDNLGVLTKQEIERFMIAGFEDGLLTDNYIFNSQLKYILPIPNINQETLRYAINNVMFDRAVKDLPASLKIDIQNVIGNNIIRGRNYRDITNSIKPLINNNRKRAEAIARTESGRCYSIGQTENDKAMTENGLTYKKIWKTLRDPKVRIDHLKMEGKEADKQGLFHLPDGSVGEAPRLTGVAKQDIRCRCGYIAEITGLTDPILNAKYLEAENKYKNLDVFIKENRSINRYYE